jgi:hypothetical protein
MSLATTAAPVRNALLCIDDEAVPPSYEFTIKDSRGNWLDWYPLQANSEDEATQLMHEWGGVYRVAPAQQQSAVNFTSGVSSEVSARASSILQTVSSWRSRLKPVPASAEAGEIWDDEFLALRSEMRDLRALITRLVEHTDATPGDTARAGKWIDALTRGAARCSAAGDAADAAILNDIALHFRINGLSRKHYLRQNQNKEISWFPRIQR